MNSRILSFYRNFSRVVSGVVLAVGLLVLVGWLFNIPALTSILPGLATMKANTALGFILCSISLWSVNHKQTERPIRLFGNACATIAVLLAVLTLGEYVSNRDFGIDQLFFQDTAAASGTAFPGRMSPVTAFNLLLLGSALLLMDNRWSNWLGEVLTIIALIIAGVAVIGYLYGVSSLYQIGVYSSVALHTALTFILLGLGILFARPERGMISIFSMEGAAGILARRLLPAAIGIPIVLGWLRLTGQRMGLYDTVFGIAVFAVSNIIVFSALIWWNAHMLHQVEAERGKAQRTLSLSEQRAQALIKNSQDAVALFGADGTILYGSPSTPQILGYSLDEFVGRNAFELIHEEDQAFVTERMTMSLQQPEAHIPIYARVRHKNGEWRWLEGVFTNLLDEPSVQAIVNNYRDITERKQAEDALRASEERFASAFHSSPNAIILADQNGNILMVNSQTAKFFGYSRMELIGLNVDSLVPERYRGIHPGYRQSFLVDPQTRAMGAGRDLYGIRKDGTEFPVEIGLTPLETQEGLLVMATIVDITERKQAEEKFYLAVEAAPNAIVLVQGDGRISLVNSQAEKFFGYDRGELNHLSIDSLVPERFRANHRGYRADFIADPQVRSMGIGRDLHALRKDGSEFPVEIGLTPIETRDGLLVMATIVDITERKHAEGKLQQQNERLKVLREIDTAILAADSIENIVSAALNHINELIDCRRANLTLIDRGANEVVIFEVRTVGETSIPKGSRLPLAQFEDIIQTLSQNQPIVFSDFRTLADPRPGIQRLLKDGLRSTCSLPLFSQGNLIGMFSMHSEIPDFFDEEKISLGREVANQLAIAITQNNLLNALRDLNAELEQRFADRTSELSQANSLLQMLLDHMPDQIYFKDAQSRFIRNSRSQAKALGLNDPAEAIGKSDFDFFSHAQQSYEKEQEIIRSGKPLVDLEERVIWPDGRETWVSTTKIPLPDQSGQIIGTFGISRDITERKRAEVAMQKAKLELEAANKELEAFSYSVSHDLRAPLRSIDGFSQALLEDYGQLLPAEGRNFLERVRSSAQRMAELIDDLLNLSKVTRAFMKLVPVDLSQLAQGIAAELQRTQPERRVNFNITPNLKARGDPSLLQAVLENLLNNAWKFTAKREQAEIEFGSKHENDETIYFIRDNGAGFDMTYVGKLFGAFQRLHAMTEFSGTGIGLATVQRIINRHGGRIWAEGEVDQGATFFFTLPALERVRPEAEPKEQDSLDKRVREII